MAEFPNFLNLQEMAKKVAEEAKKHITFMINDKEVTFDELATILRRYNAMPVVRCGLCKHRFLDGDNVVVARCELNHNSLMPDDWYCADGEVRDDNEY